MKSVTPRGKMSGAAEKDLRSPSLNRTTAFPGPQRFNALWILAVSDASVDARAFRTAQAGVDAAANEQQVMSASQKSPMYLMYAAELAIEMLKYRRRHRDWSREMIRDFIFLVLFFFLMAIWLVSWLAFHVAGGFIHVLLVVAVISLVLHLFRGSKTT